MIAADEVLRALTRIVAECTAAAVGIGCRLERPVNEFLRVGADPAGTHLARRAILGCNAGVAALAVAGAGLGPLAITVAYACAFFFCLANEVGFDALYASSSAGAVEAGLAFCVASLKRANEGARAVAGK